MRAQTQWRTFLRESPAYPTEGFGGRGIVILAGGLTYMVPAWVNIHMLRRTGLVPTGCLTTCTHFAVCGCATIFSTKRTLTYKHSMRTFLSILLRPVATSALCMVSHNSVLYTGDAGVANRVWLHNSWQFGCFEPVGLCGAGCNLPVEMFFPGKELPTVELEAALSELGVVCRPLPELQPQELPRSNATDTETDLSGFTMKVAALILSRFQEVR